MGVRDSAKDRRRRERRTKALLKTARTFDVILNHVRNGGTLISLCETWDVRYSDIIGWIRGDKAREDSYLKAGEDRSEWTKEMVLAEIRAVCRFDVRDLYYPVGHALAGTLKPIHELDAATARMVRETEVDEIVRGHGDTKRTIGVTSKVKVYDKLKALELAARSESLLTDKTEIKGSLKLEDLIAASNEPAAAPAPGASPS